jgi:electron transport complex protein RnfC
LRGGLALARNKPGIAANKEISTLRLVNDICIPLLNYQQEILEPSVVMGQAVQPGDSLASGVIASCHGVVKSIESRPVNHPSGAHAPCVVISPTTENSDNAALYPCLDIVTAERINTCAIYGLGGAGFKTADKLHAIKNTDHGLVDTLIINAVECEPLISCDEALIANQALDIVASIEGLIDFTQCRRCLLAIENDKKDAIEKLKKAIDEYAREIRFELISLAPIYPSGAERPLVERLTGIQTPSDVFPASLGILCINVATALAAEHARQGWPMVSRIITIAGELAENPTNVRVTLGTSIFDVIQQTENLSNIDEAVVRVGGPLSGFVIEDLTAPITATTNCITLERLTKPETIHPCIRCGACSDVCPVNLLPQQLHNYCVSEDTEKATTFKLSECIECACCDIVCPSNIPLTQTFRFAKGLIREQNRQSALATQAEQRYEQREVRLADRVNKRALKREAARSRLAASQDPIADALARAKQRRKRPKGD